MIRPFTLVCMLLACASGLYLYQAKHRVLMLDRQISQTVQATTAARDRAGMLRTEWTLLNDLERLRLLSDQFLRLKPLTPGQFTNLAELAGRLPAPRAAEPQTDELPALAEPDTARPAEPAPTAIAAAPPKPAAPAAEVRPKPQPTRLAAVQTVAARPQPASPQPASPVRTAAYAAQAYVAPAAPAMARRPTDGQAPPAGSSLGMARSLLPPPVPVSASAAWLPHDGN